MLAIYKEELFEAFSIFSLILIVMMSFALSITLETSLLFILIGFFPSLLTIGLSVLVYEESKFGRASVWIVPFLLIPAFYLVATNQSLLYSVLDINTLIVLNLFVIGFYLVLAFLLVKLLSMYK